MFVAALVVLVIAVLLLLAGLLGGQDTASMDFGWFTLDADVTVAFVLGMVCLALFVASWRLFRIGARHTIGRMRDKRRINALNSKVAQLEEDNSRGGGDSAADGPAPDGPASEGSGDPRQTS